MTRVSTAGLGWGLSGMLSAQCSIYWGPAEVAYGNAYGDVYDDLKHGVLLGWLCVYIIYGDWSRGEQDQLHGKWR